jgi:hypothetical protein
LRKKSLSFPVHSFNDSVRFVFCAEGTPNHDTPNHSPSLETLFKLLENADQPFDEDCVHMDCTADCEDFSDLAQQVAQGAKLEDLMPMFATHLDQIGCCRQEFEALVAVLRMSLDESD